MTATQHLPLRCEKCARSWLEAVRSGEGKSCQECGAPASVLPGASYTRDDVALFTRIDVAVRTADISLRTAERIATELKGLATRTDARNEVLLRLLDLVPALHFLLLVPEEPKVTPSAQRARWLHAAGMLQTIVIA